jgi:hypothetical protein
VHLIQLSFFFGVHAVLCSALLVCLYPEWLHVVYTLVSAYSALVLITVTLPSHQNFAVLPARLISYRRRSWHYFLFDFCYYVNILNFIFLWIAPGSPALFVACYCLSHGTLAIAVPLWRNSLVFHDADKVCQFSPPIYQALIPSSGHLFVDPRLSTTRFHHHSTLLPWGGDTIPSVKATTSDAASPGSGLYLCNVLALARSVFLILASPFRLYVPHSSLLEVCLCRQEGKSRKGGTHDFLLFPARRSTRWNW